MTAIRSTRQREIVRRALTDSTSFVTAQDLHLDILAGGERIGLATVYRTLTLLSESGQIDQIVGEDGETRYRDCSDGHHHHLRCRVCGRTEEISADEVEAWADQVGSTHGFTSISHTVELSGLCPACAERAEPAERGPDQG